MMQKNKKSSFGDWLDERLATRKLTKTLISEYWIPKNINFLWAMGVILMSLLILIIISGFFLAMYYKPDINLAFDSVNKTIMQEVKYGWLWRHIHAVGASLLFLILYIHAFVAIYFRSYKNGREIIWLSGMVLFILFSAEAFTGYVLPWGQMSYWAAQVITQLFGAIPVIGNSLVEWIRGDYAVSDPTLTRFFMIHICLLPLIVIFIVVVHFYSLRIPHINNLSGEKINFEEESKKYLLGDKKNSKVVLFWPAFLSKDFMFVAIFLIFFFYLVGFQFEFALDPINFMPADPLKTPNHIYPEWYFLWEYEILRSFFFDIGSLKAIDIGAIGILFASISLFLIPFLDRSKYVSKKDSSKVFYVWFWVLIIDMIFLSIFGKLPTDAYTLSISNTYIGFALSILYILLILVFLPIITIVEKKKARSL